MAFWSDNTLEPKRQFRFKVEFGLLQGGGTGKTDTFLAQAADRPVFTVKGDTAVHFMDKQFMFPGKVTWNPVKIRFVDTIADGVNVARKSYDYLTAAGWIKPDAITPSNADATGLRTIGKIGATSATRDVRVIVLNTAGTTVDSWKLKNAFINTVTMNNLDYAQDGVLTVEYNFIYDWAEMEASVP